MNTERLRVLLTGRQPEEEIEEESPHVVEENPKISARRLALRNTVAVMTA
jgi:hypothetical protein